MSPVPMTATWPATVPWAASALSTTGSVVAGSTSPRAPEQLRRLAHARARGRRWRRSGPARIRLPSAWPASSPSSKRRSNARASAESSSARATRHLRMSPRATTLSSSRRRPLLPPSSATETTPVSVPGVAPGRPQRHGRAVPAADGHDRGPAATAAHRSMSRWKTDTGWPCSPSRVGQRLGQRHRAVPAARAAHGDGQVRLPLAHERRQDAGQQVVHLLEEGHDSGWPST